MLKQRGAKVESTSAARSNFLQFDVGREKLPGVTDKSGSPIANPFRDARVRKALTMATDRDFLAQKILMGYGSAASQLFRLVYRAPRTNFPSPNLIMKVPKTCYPVQG